MSSSRRSRRPKSLPKNTQRLTLGGVSAAVIIVIVLIAQAVGIDVLNTGKNQTAVPTSATTIPVSETGTSVAVVPITGGIDGGWYQLYFTQPINTQDESKFVGAPIENALVNAIDGAKTSIDMAVFQFNSQPVTDALLRAQQRGVKIRVVTDGQYGLNAPDTTLDQLDAVGIPIVSDGTRSGYMHNKFFVIDGLYVWTGSTNITHNDIYNNNNNSMLIRSSQLAANYTAEFEKLFAGQFGASKPNGIPNPVITVNGVEIETYFEAEGNKAHGNDVPTRLIELINGAYSIRFMAFSFTRDDMETALIDRSQVSGVDIMGIVETSGRQYAKKMFCAGLDVKQDGNPDVLHSKVFIFDESIVTMGSFNFSKNAADDNDENMLIIHDPGIAQAYLDEFNRRWAEAQSVPLSEVGC